MSRGLWEDAQVAAECCHRPETERETGWQVILHLPSGGLLLPKCPMPAVLLVGRLEVGIRGFPILPWQRAAPHALHFGPREGVRAESLQFQAIARVEQLVVPPWARVQEGKGGRS